MMSKKITVLFLLTLIVGAIFWLNYSPSDLFGSKKIQIAYRIFSARAPGSAQPPSITFYLDKPRPIISIAVFEESDAKKNKFPHALWHLVADSAVTNVTEFIYGDNVPGMKPEIPQSLPEALQPGGNYLLAVETGDKIKGEITFHPPGN